jgi:hypothetical protein
LRSRCAGSPPAEEPVTQLEKRAEQIT